MIYRMAKTKQNSGKFSLCTWKFGRTSCKLPHMKKCAYTFCHTSFLVSDFESELFKILALNHLFNFYLPAFSEWKFVVYLWYLKT